MCLKYDLTLAENINNLTRKWPQLKISMKEETVRVEKYGLFNEKSVITHSLTG